MWNSSIRPRDRTLSGATTLGQSGPGSNGNEWVLHIPQSSSIIEGSPSDCFTLYHGHSWWWWGEVLPFLQRCSWCILQPQPSGLLQMELKIIVIEYWIYHHHHHQGVLMAQIPLSLTRHLSQSVSTLRKSSRQHPVSSESWWM